MIPNIFHFSFGLKKNFNQKPFSFIHYLAVKTAFDINKPDIIYFWYQYEPKGKWWELTKPYLKLMQIEAPTEINGIPLENAAHRCDVVRLQKLLEYGGIYLDMDVICLKPFTPLLDNKVVMGRQADQGLCNATILAEKGAEFIAIWFEQYTTNWNAVWDYHSVVLPLRLYEKHPNLVTVLDETAFFTPLWDNIKQLLYDDLGLCKNNYSVHLWETLTWNLLWKLDERYFDAKVYEFQKIVNI